MPAGRHCKGVSLDLWYFKYFIEYKKSVMGEYGNLMRSMYFIIYYTINLFTGKQTAFYKHSCPVMT